MRRDLSTNWELKMNETYLKKIKNVKFDFLHLGQYSLQCIKSLSFILIKANYIQRKKIKQINLVGKVLSWIYNHAQQAWIVS